jgi:hypothetical protein
MNIRLLFFLTVMTAIVPSVIQADEVEMQNGDRLSGKVLSVSASTVVIESEMLGKVNVPRKNILAVVFGTNASPAKTTSGVLQAAVPANPPASISLTAWLSTNGVSSASIRSPDMDTNVIRQIREQMLAGNPVAAAKFDEIADGLMSGKLDLDDLRREASVAAGQLRELKRQDPELGDSLNAYLQVLDNFLNEPAGNPADAPSPPQTKAQAP